MIRGYSKENQDLMALALYGGKRKGTYLELGSGDPISQNNTYLLERHFDWFGVSIDSNNKLEPKWKQYRKNSCFYLDATNLNYNKFFIENNLGPEIDFLQLDIDGDNQALNNFSFKALELINFKNYFFGFITFEHNLYLDYNNKERIKSREILQDYGYKLLISDVRNGNLIFEDWWICERMMPNDNWRLLQGDKIDMANTPPEQFHKIINEIVKEA